MTKHILNIIYIIFFPALYSCDKEIDTNISGGNDEYVVNATLCSDSIVSMVVYNTSNILDNSQPLFVNSVSALLYEGRSIIDTFIYNGSGRYLCKIKPVSNKPYSLKIKINGHSITSTDTIPKKVRIQSVDTFLVGNKLFCSVNITDPINTDNYYLFTMNSAQKYSPEKFIKQEFTCNDPMITNADVVDSLDGGNIIFFRDTQFKGKSHALFISLPYQKEKVLNFQLWSISHAFYNYCHSIVINRQFKSSLFNEKVKVQSNIIGGKGIFAAYSVDTLQVIL